MMSESKSESEVQTGNYSTGAKTLLKKYRRELKHRLKWSKIYKGKIHKFKRKLKLKLKIRRIYMSNMDKLNVKMEESRKEQSRQRLVKLKEYKVYLRFLKSLATKRKSMHEIYIRERNALKGQPREESLFIKVYHPKLENLIEKVLKVNEDIDEIKQKIYYYEKKFRTVDPQIIKNKILRILKNNFYVNSTKSVNQKAYEEIPSIQTSQSTITSPFSEANTSLTHVLKKIVSKNKAVKRAKKSKISLKCESLHVAEPFPIGDRKERQSTKLRSKKSAKPKIQSKYSNSTIGDFASVISNVSGETEVSSLNFKKSLTKVPTKSRLGLIPKQTLAKISEASAEDTDNLMSSNSTIKRKTKRRAKKPSKQNLVNICDINTEPAKRFTPRAETSAFELFNIYQHEHLQVPETLPHNTETKSKTKLTRTPQKKTRVQNQEERIKHMIDSMKENLKAANAVRNEAKALATIEQDSVTGVSELSSSGWQQDGVDDLSLDAAEQRIIQKLLENYKNLYQPQTQNKNSTSHENKSPMVEPLQSSNIDFYLQCLRQKIIASFEQVHGQDNEMKNENVLAAIENPDVLLVNGIREQGGADLPEEKTLAKNKTVEKANENKGKPNNKYLIQQKVEENNATEMVRANSPAKTSVNASSNQTDPKTKKSTIVKDVSKSRCRNSKKPLQETVGPDKSPHILNSSASNFTPPVVYYSPSLYQFKDVQSNDFDQRHKEKSAVKKQPNIQLTNSKRLKGTDQFSIAENPECLVNLLKRCLTKLEENKQKIFENQRLMNSQNPESKRKTCEKHKQVCCSRGMKNLLTRKTDCSPVAGKTC